MATIIALTNQKGGVGKTTTACAIISGFTNKGKKVLGIDMDPQGNMGFSLGLDIENSPSIYEVLKNQMPAEKAIQHTEFGDIIPSNILLSSAELEFSRSGREFLLKNALEPLENKYDYIIIDTPPALNVLTVNAYVAADKLIIPMAPEILSLLGVSQLKETINIVKKFYNPKLVILGIILTRYNKRINLAREVEDMAQKIAEQLDTIVFDTKIRTSVVAAEAPAHGESLFKYAPKSNAALDYSEFVRNLINLIEKQ